MFIISHSWIRMLGTGAFLVAFLFSVLPLFLGIRHVGCYAGMLCSALGIVYFAWNPRIAGLLQKVWHQDSGRIVLCVLLGVLGISVLLAILCSILMLRAACHKPEQPATVVILGCKVHRNGQPSLMLRKRLDAGYAYLTEHPDIPVIVCGGQGKDESISEAECMADYLTKKGIAPERIYQENQSTSTQENLENAKEILKQHQLEQEIILVTDGYHQYRASVVADNLHLQATAISAPTSWYLLPSYWVREWLGICYQFVFG